MDLAAAQALREMRDLYMLPGYVILLDASPAPAPLSPRLHKKPERELFSLPLEVCPAFQGMEHLVDELAKESGVTSLREAEEWLH